MCKTKKGKYPSPSISSSLSLAEGWGSPFPSSYEFLPSFPRLVGHTVHFSSAPENFTHTCIQAHTSAWKSSLLFA